MHLSTPDDELELPPEDGASDDDEPLTDTDDFEGIDLEGDVAGLRDDASIDERLFFDAETELDDESAEIGEDDAAVLDLDAVGAGEDLLGDADENLNDADEGPRAAEDDSDLVEDTYSVDAGEDGPLAEDDELREEDLPALDADGDGDFEEHDGKRALDLEWIALDPPPAAAPRGSTRRQVDATLSWSSEGELVFVEHEDAAPRVLVRRGVLAADFVDDGWSAYVERRGDEVWLATIDPHGDVADVGVVLDLLRGHGFSLDDAESFTVDDLWFDLERNVLWLKSRVGYFAFRPAWSRE